MCAIERLPSFEESQNVLCALRFEHRTFHCRNGYIVAVDLAVIVDSVAAYEGTVNTDTVKEIVGLVSDDGSVALRIMPPQM